MENTVSHAGATQMVITEAAVNLWLNTQAHSRGFAFFKYTSSTFFLILSHAMIYIFGWVCFGRREKVRGARPELIQASELRCPRQAPLPPTLPSLQLWVSSSPNRGRSLSAARQWLFGRGKKDQSTLQPEHCVPACVVSLDSFQCKCQKRGKHKECSVTIKVVIFSH